MPTFRRDLANIPVYRPGRPVEEVRRDSGLESVIKLASNECPYEPFPAVLEVIAREAPRVNRYPDNRAQELRTALAAFLQVSPDQRWLGGGATSALRSLVSSFVPWVKPDSKRGRKGILRRSLPRESRTPPSSRA